MEIAEILGRTIITAIIAVAFIVVLAMFVRRLLGVAVGLGRIIVAGGGSASVPNSPSNHASSGPIPRSDWH